MPGQQRLLCLHYYNEQALFYVALFFFLGGIALDISDVYVDLNK